MADLPVVAQIYPCGATVRLEWASVEAAHNAKPGALTPHAPAQEALEQARAEVERLRVDAERYRWLRDVSCPPHNFYISVPIEFDGVRYTAAEVDAAIDAALKSPIPGKEQT